MKIVAIIVFVFGFNFGYAQLKLVNPSFENGGVILSESPGLGIYGWKQCKTKLLEYPISAVDFEIAYPNFPCQEGFNFASWNTFTTSFEDFESISGPLGCGQFLNKTKYNFNFYFHSFFDNNIPNNIPNTVSPPEIQFYAGENLCDTNYLVYKTLLANDFPALPFQWFLKEASFISEKEANKLTIKLRHAYTINDTLYKEWNDVGTGFYLDNISNFTPDTLYNSEHNPIESNSNTFCKGSLVNLTSPYGECGMLQSWYRNDTLIGTGLQVLDTAKNSSRYTLVVGETDTCTSSVLIKDIEVLQNCGLAEILKVPNAISPNGDNINDTWHILNWANIQGLVNIKQVIIKNRQGNSVFNASNNNNFEWKPTFGKTSDIYFYFIRYTDQKNNEYIMKGDITLVQ
jgi:gliding motility-associated-like protein